MTATQAPKTKRTKPWVVQITNAPGSGVKDMKDAYESYDTAIGIMRSAARSREVRAPDSSIVISHREAGTIIWSWHGAETEVAKAVSGGAESVSWELSYDEIRNIGS